MKRATALAIAVLLCGLDRAGFAQLVFYLTDSQDDSQARWSVCDHAELKPLQDAYSEIIESHLLPLTADSVPTIFGAKLQTSEDFCSYPEKYPADLVLPLFGHGDVFGHGNVFSDDHTGVYEMVLSGVQTPNHPDHADLHAVGDIGYIEFYYKGYRDTVATAVIYLRADEKFVPLRSTNDFSKRLEWDKAKFDALLKWLDEHEPKVTELGAVAVSAASPTRVDLGGGTACVLHVDGGHEPVATSNSYRIYLTKEDPDQERTGQFAQSKLFERAGQSWVFSVDGKFYRMTPKLVGKTHEANK